jgi:hypothetical protein
MCGVSSTSGVCLCLEGALLLAALVRQRKSNAGSAGTAAAAAASVSWVTKESYCSTIVALAAA